MSYIKRINEMANAGPGREPFEKKFAKDLSLKYGHADWWLMKGHEDIHTSYKESRESRKSYNSDENAKTMLNNYIRAEANKKEISVPMNILYHFNEMTSQNLHEEVRYEIANYLSHYSNEFEEFKNYYRSYMETKPYRNTPSEFGTMYFIMDECMFIKIAKVFGDKVAADIAACL